MEEEVVSEQELNEIDGDTALSQSDEVSAEVNNDAPLIDGNELLDATQNAIVDAAENVSEALTLTEKPQDYHPKEDIPFYMDAEFWVGMSFVLVVLMIAKPIWRAVKQGLQSSIQAVIDKIDEAVKLRDDAQNLLADYERRCNDIDERVAQISEQTQKNINSYHERELKNLQRELDKKQKEVQARIERATQNAKDEINASLSVKAINLAEKAIEKHLNESDKARLIDEAIAGLDKIK